ncbi:CBS domain-containing protein [Bacteroidota bacterium]
MIAFELINDMIPALTMKDSAEKAILWMEELRTNYLPVIENGYFKGFISEEIIFEVNNLERELSNIKLIGENCYVKRNQHFYDIIKAAQDNSVDLVAVLDEEDSYLGVSTLNNVMSAIAKTSAIESPGGIIVLSMRQIDYSLAELTRLIEAESVKILSSYISNNPEDPDKLLITIKINAEDTTHLVATLERFNYQIVAKFKEHSSENSDKERYDMLMKYINI